MKYIIALTAFCLLAACDGGTTDKNGYHKNHHPTELAPMEYDCTADQMKRVQEESTWCDKNTGYFRSYCYGSAIIRNCTKKRDFSDWQNTKSVKTDGG